MTLFDAAPETARQVRVRMTLAYDGTGFSGFAAQPGQRTVAGVLGEAIEKVTGHAVKLSCAGRTDAGVHAWGQVVHLDLPLEAAPEPAVLPEVLAKACNSMLGPAVVVRSASLAPDGFDARRSAISRRYRYTIQAGEVPDPFLAHTSWFVGDPVDVRAMRAATDPLIGEKDFSAFCRRPPGHAKGEPLTRKVLDAVWEKRSPAVSCFEIEAESFCQQMVRSLVGTLVDVGRARLRAADMTAILRSGDRQRASSPAPPRGLCLLEARYPL